MKKPVGNHGFLIDLFLFQIAYLMISHSTRQRTDVPMQKEPVMIAAISQICFLRRATVCSLSSSPVSA